MTGDRAARSVRRGVDDEAHLDAAARDPPRRRPAAHPPLVPAAAPARPALPDRHPHRAALPQPLRPGAAARRGRPADRRGRLPVRAQPAALGHAASRGAGRATTPAPSSSAPAAGAQRPLRGRAVPQPARRRVAPVPGARLDDPPRGPRPRGQDERPPAAGRPLAGGARTATWCVARTAPARSRASPGGPPVYDNADTHWWDASQVYGSTPERAGGAARVRRRAPDAGRRRRPAARPGHRRRPHRGQRQLVDRPVAAALALRQGAQPRSATSRRRVPVAGDEELYARARRINAAVMAKIHTIEWTPAVLPHPTVRRRDARQLVRPARARGCRGCCGGSPAATGSSASPARPSTTTACPTR